MVNKIGFIKSIFGEGNVVTIMGAMGSGKTDKACLFMEEALKHGFHCHTIINFFRQDDINKAIKLGKLRSDIKYREAPPEIHVVTCLSELLPGLLEREKNIVFLDEAALFVSSTEATSKRVRMLKQLTYIIRHLNSSIVFICQSKNSLVPDLRENLVTYKIQISKKSENNRVMIVYKPVSYLNEIGEESTEFKVIDIRQNMPCSHLPYDSKFLPAFNIDTDIDTVLEAIGGLNSIQVKEKGPDIIKKLTGEEGKKEIKHYMSTGEYAKEIGVHPDTVRRWIKNGKIDYTKTKGGHFRIPL